MGLKARKMVQEILQTSHVALLVYACYSALIFRLVQALIIAQEETLLESNGPIRGWLKVVLNVDTRPLSIIAVGFR